MSETPLSVTQALAWLRSGAIRPGDKMLPEDLARRAQDMRTIRQMFAAYPEGLEIILRMTLFQPPVNYALPRDGRFENFALVREGQNQVAAALLTMIDDADRIERAEHELSDADLAVGGAHDGPGGLGGLGVAVR